MLEIMKVNLNKLESIYNLLKNDALSNVPANDFYEMKTILENMMENFD
jgi:hypothetical protein